GDRAPELAGPEPHEHPDPHRARPPDPGGVHSGGGLALRRRRLLADRAADPGASVRGAGAHRVVRARRGHPHAHGVGGLPRRRRYLPDLTSPNPIARNAAERMAMNAPVQGTASDMIKIAMVRVQAALAGRGLRARMLLQVHDELLFEAPPDEVATIEELAREIMAAALPLKVPAVVRVKQGDARA